MRARARESGLRPREGERIVDFRLGVCLSGSGLVIDASEGVSREKELLALAAQLYCRQRTLADATPDRGFRYDGSAQRFLERPILR